MSSSERGTPICQLTRVLSVIVPIVTRWDKPILKVIVLNRTTLRRSNFIKRPVMATWKIRVNQLGIRVMTALA